MTLRFSPCAGAAALSIRVPVLALALAVPGLAQAQIYIPSFSANEEVGGGFGGGIGGIPDLDTDGRGDFVVGAPQETSDGLTQGGRVYVYSGRIGLRLLTIPSPRNESFGNFGWSVAGVSDTDGDGKGDFIVGAPNENPGLPTDAGRAYLFSSTGALRFILGAPSAVALGRFGYSVAGVPDLTGNGRGDMVVGAPGETEAGSPTGSGRAHVFSDAGGRLFTLQAPVEQAGMSFGFSVAGVADVNGDGDGDVIVGAPYASGFPAVPKSGRVFIFSGSTGTLLRIVQSTNREDGGRFGHSVAGVADLNGDGRGDVIVGAPFEDPGLTPNSCGRAYVFSGATGQFIRALAPPQPVTNGLFGASVGGTLDLNNDFRGDVIIGAPGDNAPAVLGAGRVHIFSGATGIRLGSPSSSAPEFGGKFGASVAGAPDANNNTRSDVLAGAPGEDPGTSPSGAGRGYLLKY